MVKINHLETTSLWHPLSNEQPTSCSPLEESVYKLYFKKTAISNEIISALEDILEDSPTGVYTINNHLGKFIIRKTKNYISSVIDLDYPLRHFYTPDNYSIINDMYSTIGSYIRMSPIDYYRNDIFSVSKTCRMIDDHRHLMEIDESTLSDIMIECMYREDGEYVIELGGTTFRVEIAEQILKSVST